MITILLYTIQEMAVLTENVKPRYLRNQKIVNFLWDHIFLQLEGANLLRTGTYPALSAFSLLGMYSPDLSQIENKIFSDTYLHR